MGLKDIKIRQLTDEDMVEVSSWFSDRKWKHGPAPKSLPPTAYVAEVGGKLLSVVWVYVTNSGLALADWIATNPRAGTKGIISVKHLFSRLDQILLASGNVSICISFTHNDKLAKYLEKRCGYKRDKTKVNMSYRYIR